MCVERFRGSGFSGSKVQSFRDQKFKGSAVRGSQVSTYVCELRRTSRWTGIGQLKTILWSVFFSPRMKNHFWIFCYWSNWLLRCQRSAGGGTPENWNRWSFNKPGWIKVKWKNFAWPSIKIAINYCNKLKKYLFRPLENSLNSLKPIAMLI